MTVANQPAPIKSLTLTARNSLLSATDPDAYRAQCRRGLGRSPREVAYMAALRGAMGRASRYGTRQLYEGRMRTYKQLQGIHARYEAAMKATS
jgi:hypothetical protein